MTKRLREITDAFSLADDPELRLAMLLDFARKLPPLPDRFHAQREAGMHRVPECMTPVFLWMEHECQGGIRLYFHVAEEAPTVKGLLSIVQHAYDRATPAEAAAIPVDLLNRLHLADQLRMQRAVGISAILGRIRRAATELLPPSASDSDDHDHHVDHGDHGDHVDHVDHGAQADRVNGTPQ